MSHHCRSIEPETTSPKNPLVVDFKPPGKQSATSAWFSKVDQTVFVIKIIKMIITAMITVL